MLKILVVEDEAILKTILIKMLQDIGNCTWKADGKTAVEEFEEALNSSDPYDLITLDIMMPEVDGLQALQKIREIEENNGIKDEVQHQKGVRIVSGHAVSPFPRDEHRGDLRAISDIYTAQRSSSRCCSVVLLFCCSVGLGVWDR